MRVSTIAIVTLFAASAAQAFESTKVLPKGVRNVDIRSVQTRVEERTDGKGDAVPLAQPLSQSLTFNKIAAGEEALKASQLKAFLASNGFGEDDVVGEFSADLNGSVSVVAPIISYGVTDDLTLAIAIPHYSAATTIAVGFVPNQTAQRFLDTLALTENNQSAAAREAGDKLNNAVARLNTKLNDNGFQSLEDWEAKGIGDTTLAAKMRIYDDGLFASATTNGVVIPTGRTDDPSILNDLPFGDGQWDVFSQLIFDQSVGAGFVFNEHAKYTAQIAGKKAVREATKDEAIEVDEVNARFKLGDKVDAGASLQWQPDFGLVTGVGYAYFKKFGDLYKDVSPESKAKLEDGTDQEAHNSLAMIGYSTVPAYQQKTFGIPLDLKLTFVNQVASRNMPVSDLVQVDFNLYF